MATTTTNFGWDIPQSTDLVKDGATAIAALGQDIDTALVDLKGGTTGQVLAKASGTDLDYSWVAIDPLVILDAKGDLISATAADTPARLAVGTNNQVLTADSSTSTGLKWATPAAGGMTLLSTTTLSGSSVTISSIDQTYKNLYIEIANTTNTVGSYYPSFNPNGSTNIGDYINIINQNASFITYTPLANQYNMCYNQRNQTSSDNYWNFMIYDYASTTKKKLFTSSGFQIYSTSSKELTYSSGLWNTTSAITSVNIATGNSYNGGTVLIYGVK